jgi:hypothetical protein
MVYQKVIFTEEECDKIIEYKEKYENFLVTPKNSLMENTRTVFYEDSEIHWVKKYNVWDIPIDENTEWFYDKIYTWFSDTTGIKLDRESYFNTLGAAHKLHEYTAGDKFDLHIDKSWDNLDRIWNLGIQLNSNYTGGDYICYDEENQPIYLSKEVGNVVVYNSDTLHEITEILSGIRYSLVIKVHTWELVVKNKKSLI